jgi:hypothetical protein
MKTANRNRNRGFNATALQVRNAYQAYFHRDMPEGSYADAGNEIIAAIGQDRARAFILGQPNDVNASPVCLYTIENPSK